MNLTATTEHHLSLHFIALKELHVCEIIKLHTLLASRRC